MGTRCLIGRVTDDDKIKFISCNTDGYLDGVGNELFYIYNTEEFVNELLNTGDLIHLRSSLGKSTTYADRGFDYPARTVDTRGEFITADDTCSYLYLFIDCRWFYCKLWDESISEEFFPLTKEIVYRSEMPF